MIDGLGIAIAAMLVIAILGMLALECIDSQYRGREPDALCETDTDCMRLCRAEDLTCDGGPQGSK